MIFLIIEIYVLLTILVSLIVLSLEKENYKKIIMQQVILYYIITLVMIYESLINKDISVMLGNFNFKLYYITILLKGTILIFMINYKYIIKNFFDEEKMYVREFILIIGISIIGTYFILMSNEFFIMYLVIEIQQIIVSFLIFYFIGFFGIECIEIYKEVLNELNSKK